MLIQCRELGDSLTHSSTDTFNGRSILFECHRYILLMYFTICTSKCQRLQQQRNNRYFCSKHFHFCTHLNRFFIRTFTCSMKTLLVILLVLLLLAVKRCTSSVFFSNETVFASEGESIYAKFVNQTSPIHLVKRSVALSSNSNTASQKSNCHIRPIIHLLKYPGCVPKSIPSFACQGRCSSYVQVIAVH